MRRLLSLIAALLILALGLSFTLLNAEPVRVDFYLGEAQLPLSLWLAITLALGAILGVLSSLGLLWRQRREVRRVRRQAGTARKELTELRKLPIRDTH